jgi:hypothetical protein
MLVYTTAKVKRCDAKDMPPNGVEPVTSALLVPRSTN